MLRDLKSVFVSFCAFGSFLPTLCFTLRKSTPTPGFLRLEGLPMATRLLYGARLEPVVLSCLNTLIRDIQLVNSDGR